MSGDGTHEALAVRYGDRVTRRSESFLNYHLYGEPDAELEVAYYFWVLRSRNQSRSQSHEDDDVVLVAGHDSDVPRRFAPHRSGPAVTDVGSPVTDAGSPVTDAGSPVTDAGIPVTGEGTVRG